MPSVSAGLLLYRWADVREPGGRRLEVLLVHPGGPYWAKKDAGAWSIPKGEAERTSWVRRRTPRRLPRPGIVPPASTSWPSPGAR